MDKVKTSLQQIVRDWSDECASERAVSQYIVPYWFIYDVHWNATGASLKLSWKHIQMKNPEGIKRENASKWEAKLEKGKRRENTDLTRSNIKILVPGAGLCRLAFDIAKLGNHIFA